MSTLTELLGDQLLEHSINNNVQENSFIKTSELDGKVIGLYFSGHWCPPSRQFTPRLAEVYRAIYDEVKNQFDIVFMSWDRDQQSFDSYFNEMPWKALPYEDRIRESTLRKQFQVTGIPCLIILSPTCQVISSNGVQEISTNGIEYIRQWSANAQQRNVEEWSTGVQRVTTTRIRSTQQWSISTGAQQISTNDSEQSEQEQLKIVSVNFADADVRSDSEINSKPSVSIANADDDEEEEIPPTPRNRRLLTKSKSLLYLLLAGIICIALLLLLFLILFVVYKVTPRLRTATVVVGKTSFTDVEDVTLRAVFSTDYISKSKFEIITNLEDFTDQLNMKLSANKVRVLKAYFISHKPSKNYNRFMCQNGLLGNILQLHLLVSFVGQCRHEDYVCRVLLKENLRNSFLQLANDTIRVSFDDDRIVNINIKLCTLTDTLDIEEMEEEEELVPTERPLVVTPIPQCAIRPVKINLVHIHGQEGTEIRDEVSNNRPSSVVTYYENSVNSLRIQLDCGERTNDEFSCSRVYYVEVSIDLNNDGLFDEVENRVHPRSLIHSETTQGTFQFEVSIPSIDGTKTKAGSHRMRLRVYPGKEFRKNCGTHDYSETRDYKVNIISKPTYVASIVHPVVVEHKFICLSNVEKIKTILIGGELGTQIRDSSQTDAVTNEITFFGDAVYLVRVQLDCARQSDDDCTRAHYVDIFIDFNGDGKFDQSENRVFRRSHIPEETPENTFDLQILIPRIDEISIKTGLHRMRVVLLRSEAYQKQCGRNQHSVAREYMVNIIPRKTCHEREYVAQPKLEFESEEEPEPDYVVQLTADFSNRAYCSTGDLACSAGNVGIYSVELVGEESTLINDDIESCRSSNNYEDRSQFVVKLFDSTTYSLRLQLYCIQSKISSSPINCDSNYHFGVWIDFNNDGVFDETRERLSNNYRIDSISSQGDYDLSIHIPQIDGQNYRDGSHRMRIVLTKHENNLQACYNSGYGEARDYTVNISQKKQYY